MPAGMGCSMDAVSSRLMPAVDPPSWFPALHALQRRYPTAHPYTLAILLEVETGVRITGQVAARWLRSENRAAGSGCAMP